jgi:hypothetical protein
MQHLTNIDLRQALTRLAPPFVRDRRPDGLAAFIERVVLRNGDQDGYAISAVGREARRFRNGFVYDRGAGILFPCEFGRHSRLAGVLARLRTLPDPTPDVADELFRLSLRAGDEAERFLDEGWGFVVNSPELSGQDLDRPWPMQVGRDVTLTAQEKILFRAFDVVRRG